MYSDKIEESKKFFILLRDGIESLSVDVYGFYLRNYEKICKEHGNLVSWVHMRLVRYFRGEYYRKTHEYIYAEKAFKEALGTKAPQETCCLVTDIKIKCELLKVYYVINNLESASPLLEELMDRGADYYNQGLDKTDIYEIYTINNDYGRWSQKNIHKLREMLKRERGDIEQNRSEPYCKTELIFIFTSILLMVEEKWASRDECEVYLEMLKKIGGMQDVLETEVQLLMFRTLARLAGELNLSDEADYLKECLELVEKDEEGYEAKAEIYQAAASFYFGKGEKKKGRQYLDCSLQMITLIWQSAIRYLGKRVYQILGSAEYNFLGCYDAIHKYMDIEFAYEKLLQFKALASLAVRERNRVFYSGKISTKLLQRIQEAQDKVAWRETEKICICKAQYQYSESEFLDLETDLAEQFPKDVSFVEISLEKVMKAIPDNSAIIEYLVYEIDYEKHEFTSSSMQSQLVIDIYVLRKKNGECCLQRRKVLNGKNVLKESEELVSIFQNDEVTLKEKKEYLKNRLYYKLIEPILFLIKGIEHLYIAPDRNLLNLPFGILNNESGIPFGEYFNISRIECGRDFLFGDINCKPIKGSLILGNPAYAINSKGEPSLQLLPFSQKEVKIISAYYNCKYYSGKEASKKLLLTASGYKNIHIATHSNFDLSKMTMKDESMYSSFLVFAGAADWMKTGEIDRNYGNGIVTADEISRIDLRSVELVVLSSCRSGMNKIIENKGLHGLVGAFAEAGVRYVISHLWQADDFATAVLMNCFYYFYVVKNLSPSVALRRAKKALKRVTIRQLREKGWLSENEALAMGYQTCPFEDEIYWGGFFCYRCRR